MPRDNRYLLESLFAGGHMPVHRGPLFDEAPRGRPASWDRVQGMMLGLAIADALGNTSEGMVPSRRREVRGEIRGYLPNRYAEERRVGVPSDDSQMAFWTLESALEHDGLDPEALARLFVDRQIFEMGSSVRAFVTRHGIRRVGRTRIALIRPRRSTGASLVQQRRPGPPSPAYPES